MLRPSCEISSSANEVELFEHTNHGEALPPTLHVVGESKQGFVTQSARRYDHVYRAKTFNNNKRDVIPGFGDNKSNHFYNSEITSKNQSSGKHNIDQSITTRAVDFPIMDRFFSQPGSPAVQRYQFARESQSRMSDAEVIKKKKNQMSLGHFSQESPPKQYTAMRKRHSSGGALPRKPVLDGRELAFGPVWLDGNGYSEHKSAWDQNRQGTTCVLPDSFVARLSNDKEKQFGVTTRSTSGTFPVEEKQATTGNRPTNQSEGRRKTIAPIGSLDDQIKERRNKPKPQALRSLAQPKKAIQNLIQISPKLAKAASLPDSTSEESESVSRSDKTYVHVSLKGRSGELTRIGRASSSVPDIPRVVSSEIIVNCSHSGSVAEMKSALRRVRSMRNNSGQQNCSPGPLKPTRQQSLSPESNLGQENARDRSGSSFSLQPPVELRKRSGSFGSRMLRRAKSAVTRQSKIYDMNDNEGNFADDSPRTNNRSVKKQTSLNEKSNKRMSFPNSLSVINQSSVDGSFYEQDSLHGISEAEVVKLSSVSSETNILMQGDLLRRKRLTWAKTWGVLTTDSLLTLYKSKRDFETARQGRPSPTGTKYQTFTGGTSLSGILSIVNLGGGYEIEILEQGKKGCTFQIIPHSYHTFTLQGMTSTLPVGADWRKAQKSVQLMCKNNDEAIYWVKALVELSNKNAAPDRRQRRRNLALTSDSPDSFHRPTSPSNFEGVQRISKNWVAGTDTTAEATDRPITGQMACQQRRDIPVENVLTMESAQQGNSRTSSFGIPATSKSDTTTKLNLDELKFIDEDDDEEASYIRVMPTISSETFQQNKPRDIYNLCHNGRVLLAGRSHNEVGQKALSKAKLESKRQEMQDSRRNSDDSIESEGELKRCSKKEKVDMRKAQLIAGGSSPSDLNSNTQMVEDGNRENSCKDKYIESFQSRTKQNCKLINIDTTHRQEKSDLVRKANGEATERALSEREKRERRKKNLIALPSDCKVQTLRSLQDDKKVGVIDGTGIFRGNRTPTENIRNELGSAKDKHRSATAELCESSKDSRIGGENKDSESGNSVSDESAAQKFDTFTPSFSLSRNERYSIKHISSRSGHVRKQKSLRQKVLRKLGPQVLSNSTPDLNAAVEDEALDLQSAFSQHSEVKLRRQEAFRSDCRPFTPGPLTRWLSEGDLLELETEVDGGNMRTFKNVRKLTEDTFLETYGAMPRKKAGRGLEQRRRDATYDANKNDCQEFTHYNDENGFPRVIETERRPSTSESSSGESSHYQASMTYSEPAGTPAGEVLKSPISISKSEEVQTVVRRKRSPGSDESGNKQTPNKESRNSWIASLAPHFARKANKDSSASKDPSKNSKKAVFQIPASNLTAASHRGYLDKRNKKKQWEKFWYVLQDSCLYCYNAPQSECTQDAVVLRGYDVIADVTNMNRTRFPFRLERNGSPTLHFSSDNHRDFVLWVGSLVKETRNVLPASTDNEVLVNSVKNSTNTSINEEETRLKSAERGTKDEPYESQKENLLREVLAQQHKFIEEQRQLQKKTANAHLTKPTDITTARSSKDEVDEKYTKAREHEEIKMMKCLTHLNKRRNSAQLKVDNITKQLGPKVGRKRRENPQQFADMEAKLKLLQDQLKAVDKEIQNKRAMKQDVIEKIQQRRDLEFLIIEQREALEIIHRHNERQKRISIAQQTQSRDGSERLGSIDEISTISECSSASSNSLPDPLSFSADCRISAVSTPQRKHVERNSDKTNSAGNDSARDARRSSDMDEGINFVAGSLNSDLRTMSTSSEEPEVPHTSAPSASNFDEQSSKKDDIDPSILADIEDFQRFSRQKLALLASNP